MSVTEWAAVSAVLMTFIGGLAIMLKFYVDAIVEKSIHIIMREFKPNGGNSMRDRVDSLEKRQIQILNLLQLDHK